MLGKIIPCNLVLENWSKWALTISDFGGKVLSVLPWEQLVGQNEH